MARVVKCPGCGMSNRLMQPTSHAVRCGKCHRDLTTEFKARGLLERMADKMAESRKAGRFGKVNGIV